jgi:hypothetical protein
MMASDFVRRRAEAAGDRGAPEREGGAGNGGPLMTNLRPSRFKEAN